MTAAPAPMAPPQAQITVGRDHNALHTLDGVWIPNQPVSKPVNLTLTIITLAVLGGIWMVGAAAFLPTPVDVIKAFPALLDKGLGIKLWSSLMLNFAAAALIFVISLGIAYSTVLPFMRPFAQIVSCGRFNGMVGMPLIFMSLLHNPRKVQVALLVFGTTVFAVMSLTTMIRGIPKAQFDLCRTLRMGEWRTAWEVVVLGQFDQTLDILRVNYAMCWMLLPLVEGYFKFEGGIGALMEVEQNHLHLDVVICGLFVIMAVGFVQDWAIRQVRTLCCPGADLALERQ